MMISTAVARSLESNSHTPTPIETFKEFVKLSSAMYLYQFFNSFIYLTILSFLERNTIGVKQSNTKWTIVRQRSHVPIQRFFGE